MPVRPSRSLPLAVLVLAAAASTVRAQTPTVDLDGRLPFATRRFIRTSLDAPGAAVATGDSTIPAGSTVPGPIVHLGGTLILEGTVTGDVTAVGSEVYVRPSARIEGDLVVIGGGYYGSAMATVTGRTTWLRDEPVEVVEDAPGRVRVVYSAPPVGFPFEPKGLMGIVVHEYNGVDGLSFGLVAGLKRIPGQPRTELSFGPVFRTARSEVGWQVAGLRELPEAGGLTLGGAAYRITDSPQAWHRGPLGNSLSALVLGDDNRTYFERTGFEAWASRSFRLPFTFRVRWRLDEFRSLEGVTPFAILGNDSDWPTNPPIEEGQGRALGADFTIDHRNVPEFPTSGFWVKGQVDHWGFGGDFDFDWAQGEARAWLPLPVGSRSFASVRVAGGGRLRTAGAAGDTLAPQFWYRIGGGGTIPGYEPLRASLTGDRMAFATGTIHLGIPTEGFYFDRIYVVGLASTGDAWFPGEQRKLQTGFGGGIAGQGQTTYAGLFAAYGVEEKSWQVYARITPWF